jgi:hypothetical protein
MGKDPIVISTTLGRSVEDVQVNYNQILDVLVNNDPPSPSLEDVQK